MSAVLQERAEEVVQLGPEHRLIFDLIAEIKHDATEDRKILQSDIKQISAKLDKHLGYHHGLQTSQTSQKSTVLAIVQSLVSLFKEQPLILVILVGMVLLISVDTLTSLRGFLPW